MQIGGHLLQLFEQIVLNAFACPSLTNANISGTCLRVEMITLPHSAAAPYDQLSTVSALLRLSCLSEKWPTTMHFQTDRWKYTSKEWTQRYSNSIEQRSLFVSLDFFARFCCF